MKSLKILQVIPSFDVAGAETMCVQLSVELKKKGHDVRVATLYNRKSSLYESLEKAGIKIYWIDKKRGIDLTIFSKINKAIKDFEPDVVHTHLYTQIYTILPAAANRIKRKIHTIHSVADKDCKWYVKIANKFFYRFGNMKFVALNEKVKESIAIEYNINSSNIHTVSNGIDLEKCIPKASYELNGNFKIVHVGRFSKEKNHERLISSFEIFKSKVANSELHLVGNGELIDCIKSIVSNKKLTGSVFFHGLVDNVYPILHDSDAFILTSDYEGAPMSLLEAMGTGLPIISTNVGGISDILTNDVNGILTSVDEKDIAESVYRIYIDDEFRTTIGKAALKESKEYSLEKMCKDYIKIYNGSVLN